MVLGLMMALNAQVMAQSSDDLELLDIEAPGCGNGGGNYLGEVTSYDPLEAQPDLTMEPATSVSTARNPATRASHENLKADAHCIDSFERDGN